MNKTFNHNKCECCIYYFITGYWLFAGLHFSLQKTDTPQYIKYYLKIIHFLRIVKYRLYLFHYSWCFGSQVPDYASIWHPCLYVHSLSLFLSVSLFFTLSLAHPSLSLCLSVHVCEWVSWPQHTFSLKRIWNFQKHKVGQQLFLLTAPLDFFF